MKQSIIQYLLIAALAAAVINIYVKVYTDLDTKYIRESETENTVKTLANQVQTINDTNTQGFSLSFRSRPAQAIINVQGGSSFNGYIYDTDLPTFNITELFPENITSTCNCTDNLYYSLEIIAVSNTCCVYSYVSSDFKFICINYAYGDSYFGCAQLTDSCSLISGTTLQIPGVTVNNAILLYRTIIGAC